jgi:hypothetical protein
MDRSYLAIFVCIVLSTLPLSASAQTPATKPKPTLTSAAAAKDKSDPKAEASRIAAERRTQARLVLTSLASDAGTFFDQILRARSLAKIADAMWNFDAEQGRNLFRKAWYAAESADANPAPYNVGQRPPNLRGEVLRLTAQCDRLLADEFLEKLKADQSETETAKSVSNRWALPEASEQRLNLAKGFLGTGDIQRALQLADPILTNVTISTVEFLTSLRAKDPAAADQRYAAMLANTGGNILADANIVSLLSSYIFTPHLYVIFSDHGVNSSSMPSQSPPASVDPQLRLVFFQAASGVLLRPESPSEPGQPRTGVVARYMVVKRLMPLFEQYASQEMATAMRIKLDELNSLIHGTQRPDDEEWVQKGISPEKPLEDQEKPLLEQIEHAKTSKERDELFFKLALLALNKDDLKARDHVSRIDDSGFRKMAQAWIDASLAINAITKKNATLALELARSGELTHIQRVWVLTQASMLLAKTNPEKSASLINEATAEAHRIEGSNPDRPRALLAIANAQSRIEPSGAWDALLESVNAANSTEGFTGEDGVLVLHMNSSVGNSTRTVGVSEFDLGGIFGWLAIEDFSRANQLARGFQAEAPRVNATLAIVRTVLNEKPAPVPTPKSTTKK